MKKSVSLMLILPTLILTCPPASVWGAAQQPIGCLIQPELVSEVSSPVVGVVESMLVERGDTVRKGQVIAILRNEVDRSSLNVANSRSRAKAEVRAAKANLLFAKQRLERARGLHDKKLISTQVFEQTVAEAEEAQQKLAQAHEQQHILINEVSVAKARIKDRTIRSPFGGVIAERYISVGEHVDERPLVRVVKLDSLRVEVIMPSSLFGSVVVGSMARVTPELAGTSAVTAKVTLVDKILDAASGTFRVRLNLPNPDTRIPAGLRCKIDFAATTEPNKLSSPQAGADTKLKPVKPKPEGKLSTPREAGSPVSKQM